MKNGFTLIELLVVLSIIVIGATLVVPSLSSLMASSQLNSSARDLVNILSQARSEAISRNSQVSIVPAGGLWSADWSIITDDNGNGIQDGTDVLIGVRNSKSGVNFVNADTMYSGFAGYLSNGFGVGSGGQGGGLFQICLINNATPISRIVTITSTGKPSVSVGPVCS